MILANLDETNPNEVEAVSRIALTADYLARSKALQFHSIAKVVDEVLGKRGEDRNALEVSLKRADAVIGVELGAERLILLEDVEHVAQHLQTDNIFGRDHRRAARIEVHACHLTEEIAGVKFCNRMVVFEIDWRIDVDKLARRVFFLALMLFARL